MSQSYQPSSNPHAPVNPQSGPYPAEGVPTLDLLQVLRTLRTNRYFIALLTVIIAAAALSVMLLIPPKYSAVTRILIDPRSLQIVEKDLTPSGQASDSLFAIVESQLRVMISDEILRPVITSQHLETDPEFGGWKDSIIYAFIGIDRPEQPPDLKALRRLWRAVWAEREKGSYIVDLSVKTKDPAKSARIANTIATTYVKSELAVRANMAWRASNALTARLGEMQTRLRKADNSIEKYKASHNIVGSEGKLVNEQQLTQLNQELSVARAQTAKAKSMYEQIKLLKKSNVSPSVIADAVQSDTIKELRVRYAAALQTEMSLASQILPSHPDLQRGRARTATIRREISNELTRITEAARIEYMRAKGNEEELRHDVDKLKGTALSTDKAQVELRALMRDADAIRLVYNAFLLRARELAEQQGVDTSIARILSPAIPPLKPNGPSLRLTMVLLLIVAFSLSVFYVLAREYIKSDVRRENV